MKYILLTEYFPESEKAEFTGGVENRCFYLVKELSKYHSVTVLCSHQPQQPRISTIFNNNVNFQNNNVKIIRCGPTMLYSSAGNIIYRLKFSYALYKTGKKVIRKWIKMGNDKENYLIEAESFLGYIPAYFLGKKYKIRKIATWHETWVGGDWIKNKGLITGICGELWEKFSLSLNWDKIITPTEFTKNQLIKAGVKKDKIVIIPNGIDLEKLQAIKSIPTNKRKSNNPTLCYFGRITKKKNLDVLIRALAMVQKQIPGIKCKILGSGPELENLKILAKKLRIEKNIYFSGYIKNYNDMLLEAKDCTIYIHPSTVEGFGITVLEAMSLGLPFVISNIPPFLEVTNNGLGGEIFIQNNPFDLAEKILELLNSSSKYSQKITEGQQIIKKYDWKNIVNNYDQKIFLTPD